jgi:hypothetical protein
MARIAAAIGAPDAAVGLHRMAVELGVPTALRDLGLKEVDLDRACEIALANPVRRVVDLCERYERPVATPAEARRILDLTERART